MKYRKLAQTVFRQGKGLHSGLDYALIIAPSDENLSIEAGGERLFLSQAGLNGSGRGSDLIFPSGKRVRTYEHVLSALTGTGVWQAKLTVTGPAEGGLEMPGLDGCAENLAREILEKSIADDADKTDKKMSPLKLQTPIQAGSADGPAPRFIAAFPSARFQITYVIDYAAAPIGTRIFDFSEDTDYLNEIAPARTFALRSDIEALRAAGMALGGSLDNAVLVDADGVETSGGLRFPDEFVRHKVLDLIGDLAALGRPLAAHVVAVRAGHVQHLQLVERLRALSRI